GGQAATEPLRLECDRFEPETHGNSRDALPAGRHPPGPAQDHQRHNHHECLARRDHGKTLRRTRVKREVPGDCDAETEVSALRPRAPRRHETFVRVKARRLYGWRPLAPRTPCLRGVGRETECPSVPPCLRGPAVTPNDLRASVSPRSRRDPE